MQAPKFKRSGFTLVELLVVIAIIGILAGLTASVLPRVLERAKIARMEAVFKNLQTALASYYTDHDSFPPAYGYLMEGVDEDGFPTLIPNNRPWMAFLKIHEDLDQYDQFAANGADADRDGNITRFEFAALGTKNAGTSTVQFLNAIYDPATPGPFTSELNRMRNRDERPIIYVPVNSRNHARVRRNWYDAAAQPPNPDPSNPRPNDNEAVNGALQDLVANGAFPPPRYDSYVLISVGPAESTFGLVFSGETGIFNLANYNNGLFVCCPDENGQPRQFDASYHVLAHAIYFMATRDADPDSTGNPVGDGLLDFEFRARTRGSQAKSPSNRLPSPVAPNGAGPLIFVQER